MDQNVDSGVDDGIYNAIKLLEQNQIDAIGMELMFRGSRGVEGTVSGTRVNEGTDQGCQKEIGGDRDCKGVQVVKSRCIESWLCGCTGEFNAVLSQCRDKRTAHISFDSEPDLASDVLSVTVVEQPLAAEEVAFEHFFATCPPFLQKRVRFWLKWHWRSCWVGLPSFLSLEERSELGFPWLVLPELVFLVVLEVLELPELFLLLLLFLFLSELGVVVLLVLVPLPLSLEHLGFRAVRVSLATLEQHSQ